MGPVWPEQVGPRAVTEKPAGQSSAQTDTSQFLRLNISVNGCKSSPGVTVKGDEMTFLTGRQSLLFLDQAQ